MAAMMSMLVNLTIHSFHSLAGFVCIAVASGFLPVGLHGFMASTSGDDAY